MHHPAKQGSSVIAVPAPAPAGVVSAHEAARHPFPPFPLRAAKLGPGLRGTRFALQEDCRNQAFMCFARPGHAAHVPECCTWRGRDMHVCDTRVRQGRVRYTRYSMPHAETVRRMALTWSPGVIGRATHSVHSWSTCTFFSVRGVDKRQQRRSLCIESIVRPSYMHHAPAGTHDYAGTSSALRVVLVLETSALLPSARNLSFPSACPSLESQSSLGDLRTAGRRGTQPLSRSVFPFRFAPRSARLSLSACTAD